MRIHASRGFAEFAIRLGVTLLILAAVPLAASAEDASTVGPRTVWVQDAGHTVDGLFLDTWRKFPDLLGLPITEEMTAPVSVDGQPAVERTVQYFERMALVYLPDAADPDDRVTAMPLGVDLFKVESKRAGSPAWPQTGSCAGVTDCQQFKETGHTVRGTFRQFWEKNGGDRLIGQPLSEAVSAGGVTTQYFENAVLRQRDGKAVTPRSIGSEMATKLSLRSDPISQPLGIPVYAASLFTAPAADAPAVGGNQDSAATADNPEPDPIVPIDAADATTADPVADEPVAEPVEIIGPGPQQGTGQEIVVSISAQAMWAYDGDQLVIESLVSTGVGDVPETVTPTGYFSVLTKLPVQTMEGTISDEYYRVDDVPYVMYFDNNGDALHGTYWHENFGTPMSHGCVNLPMDVAAFLFDWASEGTAVTIID